jgi:hypothetical protein
MNIIQIQDRLKGVPDDALIGYVETPTGEVPSYLALSELQRRKDMRERYQSQAEPEKSVSDQLISESMPQGLGAMMPTGIPEAPQEGVGALPPQPEMSPDMMTQAGVGSLPAGNVGQNYAGGGIVSFAEGGKASYPYTYDYEDYYLNPTAALSEVPKKLEVGDVVARQKAAQEGFGVDPQFYANQAKELQADRDALKADKSTAGNMALIQAGLGIMGGTSQHALENVAKGAMPALESYKADTKSIKEEDRMLKMADMKLKEAQQAQARGDANSAVKAMDERDNIIRTVQMKNAELETQIDIANYKANLDKTAAGKDLYKNAVKSTQDRMNQLYPTQSALATAFGDDKEKEKLEFNRLLQENLNLLQGNISNTGVSSSSSIPPGSKPTGQESADGRPIYLTPDGKKILG